MLHFYNSVRLTKGEITVPKSRKPRNRKVRTSVQSEVFENFGGHSPTLAYEVDRVEVEVADFVSNLPNAKPEVHVLQYIKGNREQPPIVARFTSAEGLKNHIEILIKHYHSAFDDAEPIDPEGDDEQYEKGGTQ